MRCSGSALRAGRRARPLESSGAKTALRHSERCAESLTPTPSKTAMKIPAFSWGAAPGQQARRVGKGVSQQAERTGSSAGWLFVLRARVPPATASPPRFTFFKLFPAS